MSKCCAPGCNTKKRDKITFFKIPFNHVMRKAWESRLSGHKLKDSDLVCGKHFKLKDVLVSKTGEQKLRINACPNMPDKIEKKTLAATRSTSTIQPPTTRSTPIITPSTTRSTPIIPPTTRSTPIITPPVPTVPAPSIPPTVITNKKKSTKPTKVTKPTKFVLPMITPKTELPEDEYLDQCAVPYNASNMESSPPSKSKNNKKTRKKLVPMINSEAYSILDPLDLKDEIMEYNEVIPEVHNGPATFSLIPTSNVLQPDIKPLDRIAQLETENSHLKAKYAQLINEFVQMKTEKIQLKAELDAALAANRSFQNGVNKYEIMQQQDIENGYDTIIGF